MLTIIPIWISKSKNRFHYLEKGERLKIRLERGMGKKQSKIIFTRQFFNYPSWEDIERCGFSINRRVLRELKETLDGLRD